MACTFAVYATATPSPRTLFKLINFDVNLVERRDARGRPVLDGLDARRVQPADREVEDGGVGEPRRVGNEEPGVLLERRPDGREGPQQPCLLYTSPSPRD